MIGTKGRTGRRHLARRSGIGDGTAIMMSVFAASLGSRRMVMAVYTYRVCWLV